MENKIEIILGYVLFTTLALCLAEYIGWAIILIVVGTATFCVCKGIKCLWDKIFHRNK